MRHNDTMNEYHPQTPKEELANSLTHAAGLALSLICLGVLLTLGWSKGLWPLLVSGFYGFSLVQLFAISAGYHACPNIPFKHKARILDHCSIYLLIAGSYAPFMLLSLGGWRGWCVMLAVASLTIYGIHRKLTKQELIGFRSVALYLVNGWLVLLVLAPLARSLPSPSLDWLLWGGLFYTGGIVFYAWRTLRFSHAIWHLFVLAGAACHFISVAHVVTA